MSKDDFELIIKNRLTVVKARNDPSFNHDSLNINNNNDTNKKIVAGNHNYENSQDDNNPNNGLSNKHIEHTDEDGKTLQGYNFRNWARKQTIRILNKRYDDNSFVPSGIKRLHSLKTKEFNDKLSRLHGGSHGNTNKVNSNMSEVSSVAPEMKFPQRIRIDENKPIIHDKFTDNLISKKN